MIITNLEADKGYTPIVHGNSYIQVISWDEAGNLNPRAMLTYPQSPEPESPHYSDLTEIRAQGGWIRLPFTDAEIEADPNLRAPNLTERDQGTPRTALAHSAQHLQLRSCNQVGACPGVSGQFAHTLSPIEFRDRVDRCFALGLCPRKPHGI